MKRNITCRTLLGSGNLDFSIECLKSLLDNSYDNISLQIFEDGSLQDSDIKKIESSLPNSAVITRKSREKRVIEQLSDYPYCRQLRENNVFGFKLFDTMLYDDVDFFYLDTDIYFLQQFILPDFGQSPVFMRDNINGYYFKKRQFLKIDAPVMPLVNAGFYYFPYKLYKLSSIENILKKYYSPANMSHMWAEQTLWAFLGAEVKEVYYFSPQQVILAKHKLPLDNESIAVHLVSIARRNFGAVKSLSQKNNQPSGDFKKIKLEKINTTLSNTSFAFGWIKQKIAGVKRRLTKPDVTFN
jgi:hypothetical protein